MLNKNVPIGMFAIVCTGAVIVGGSGCASLDARPDIQRAATTVQQRSAIAPVWDEPWMVTPPDALDSNSPASDRVHLTSRMAVALALQNNRELRAEVELIAAARADLVQAGLLPNPVLGFTLRFPEAGSTFVGVSLVQQFTAIWLRPTRIHAADARLNQAVLNVSDRALRMAADVKQSCARIIYGERGLRLTEENLQMLEESVNAVTELVRAGEGDALSVNRIKQQWLHLRADLIEQQQAVEKERRALLEMMGFAEAPADFGLHEGEDAEVASTAADVEWTPVFAGSEAEVIALAREQRLDVAASRALVQALRADLKAAELGRLTDLEAGVDFERMDRVNSVGPMIGVGVPIFDFNHAQAAKAGAEASHALALYEATLHRAIAQARIAYIDVARTAELTQLQAGEVLALARHNLSLIEESFGAGQDDITVLLEAQREVINARRTLNEWRARLAEAMIELEYAIGGALPQQN